MKRKSFLTALGALAVTPAIALRSAKDIGPIGTPETGRAVRQPAVRWPAPLREGDRIGISAPAGRVTDPDAFPKIASTLREMGLEPVFAPGVREAYGYLSGTDERRAADLNAFFADPGIAGILALRGGWGSNRILPLLDFDVIARNPKFFCGYSDITSLLNSIHARTGLVTFHGPNSNSTYTPWTREHFLDVAFARRERYVLRPDDSVAPSRIVGGAAEGRLLGGNLTVFTSILGSDYVPDLTGAILFLEDIGEDVYRVDRMMSQLALSGILEKISGFVFGRCTDCDESAPFTLTLSQVLQDYLSPLSIPAFYGTMISHGQDIFTLPVGWTVRLDADRFEITFAGPST